MSYKKINEGNRSKPRGKPFPKNNIRGKVKDDLLVTTRYESSDGGGNITHSIDSLIIDNEKEYMKESEKEAIEECHEIKDLEKIDSIDFKNGKNTLSIRFSRRHNRMFRVQIFLNDQTEIRPVTYNGSSTGYTFWNILKGLLKN